VSGVRAIVVGVEQHRSGWKLDGPARDAVRFIEILRARHVADESITLLTNPLPNNVSVVEGTGIAYAEPTRETVSRVLRAELAADPAEQLYFFWGGHGVVDGEDNRRLFYADATLTDKRNLDFTDFLASLRTLAYPAQRRQFLAVDACQNFAAQLRYATTLPHDRMPQGAPAAGREQHVLFAASPGQVARNDSDDKTGVFSRELLALLADDGLAWPPDAARLAERLTEVFDRIREADATAQTPTYQWHKTPREEGLISAIAVPRPAARPTVDQLSELTTAMQAEDELSFSPGIRTIVLLMPPALRASIPYDEVARTYLLRWLRAAVDQREEIVRALRNGMANQDALKRVLAAFDQHWPAGGAP
jgi:hypothetical protein